MLRVTATVADTAAWLDIHKIPYRDLCFLGAKPQVEADAYIDDAPHNIEQLRAARPPILLDHPMERGLALMLLRLPEALREMAERSSIRAAI